MTEPDTNTPNPAEIKLHQKSRMLEISFADGNTFRFPGEFLRVYSPSAEVRGHGPGQGILQLGKQDVEITHIEPVRNYAIQPTFSDGHNTRIYSRDVLYDYGLRQEELWRQRERAASRAPRLSSSGRNQIDLRRELRWKRRSPATCTRHISADPW